MEKRQTGSQRLEGLIEFMSSFRGSDWLELYEFVSDWLDHAVGKCITVSFQSLSIIIGYFFVLVNELMLPS